MKIREAQEIYREQTKTYRMQKGVLAKQLQTLHNRMEASAEGQEKYGSEAATLELTLNKLDEKQKECQDYLAELSEQYCAYWNAAAARQQAEAGEDYAVEMGKMIEVARRIMKGAIVPASDEKKLMEFSQEMYQMAKNIGSMVQSQKREKYDSLWGDEEEKEYTDPREAADNAEVMSEGPQDDGAAAIVTSA